MLNRIFHNVLLFLSISVMLGCNGKEEKLEWVTTTVTATAYNSVASQTANHPELAAWGDTLKPGMKVIAVSRDLIPKGLKYNTPVKIEGLEGTYYIKDKMHGRWTNRIDIFMGKDVVRAKEWGRRKVVIQYGIPRSSISNEDAKR